MKAVETADVKGVVRPLVAIHEGFCEGMWASSKPVSTETRLNMTYLALPQPSTYAFIDNQGDFGILPLTRHRSRR
jgi:hypothetical protein